MQRGARSGGPMQRDTMDTEVGRLRCDTFASLRFWWFVFVGLHLLCLAYFATVAWCYWHLPGTTLDMNLYYYGLGLGSDHDRTIAVVHGCIGVVHLVSLLWMIGFSVYKWRLMFPGFGFNSKSTTRPEKTRKRNDTLGFIYRGIESAVGVFCFNSPYYDLVLLGREVMETALQTQQAYNMSLLLSRTQLNQCYIAFLVLSCWSTVIVHSVFHGSTVRRRFYALLIDCLLDFVTSVGISTALLMIYLPDFDFELSDFPLETWGIDAWLIRVISEFQIMLVSSWGNLAARVVFALSMLNNMNTMKKLLGSVASRSCLGNRRHIASVSPLDQTDGGTLQTVVAVESRFTRLLFFAWGVIILAIHLCAESVEAVSQCKMQVKPWFSTKASCSLLVLDCNGARISGSESEVADQWHIIDLSTPTGLVILHCPAFEMPTLLTKCSGLKMLKFYNSTIAHWGEDAPLSDQYHPNLIMLYLARVNMTDGQFPRGLQGDDLPHNMLDIEFCVTNLRTLPDDFDLKWPKFSSIYFEASNMTEVPASLARLAPYDVSLSYNPISTIPAELFEGNMAYLHIGGTLISELPEHVEDVYPLEQLRVDNTNVSFFWDWLDPIVEGADIILSDVAATVIAANTPYCKDLQRIYDGELSGFSVSKREGQSSILSDASMSNWGVLRKAVSCEESSPMMYTLEADDRSYAISQILELEKQ